MRPNCLRGVVLMLGAAMATLAHAEERDAFAFGAQRFVGGVLDQDVDHATRVVGWKLSDRVFFGRRSGDIDDFGFVLHDGDTQWSFTESGLGWRRSVSLFPRARANR